MPKTLDTIYIRELKAACVIGTRPTERARQQQVVLNLALSCNLARAATTDNLRHTVDYAAVARRVVAVVRRSRRRLLERLAHEVAETCLAFPGVAGVRVTIDKPGAIRNARSVAVELQR